MSRQKTEVAERWVEIEKYVTIKHLKKQLTRKARRQRLSDGTWRTYRYWLGKFIPFTQKSPDELIEDALRDNEETENLLIDFKIVLNAAYLTCKPITFQDLYSIGAEDTGVLNHFLSFVYAPHFPHLGIFILVAITKPHPSHSTSLSFVFSLYPLGSPGFTYSNRLTY